jgi:putative intracellular protease/amidase
MRRGDFSQLPFRRGEDWELITRDQIARWVESVTDADGVALLDLRIPVGEVTAAPRVHTVRPATVAGDDPISRATEALEKALRTPDDVPGGYPAVLVIHGERTPPGILTADDLPGLYDLLGR